MAKHQEMLRILVVRDLRSSWCSLTMLYGFRGMAGPIQFANANGSDHLSLGPSMCKIEVEDLYVRNHCTYVFASSVVIYCHLSPTVSFLFAMTEYQTLS